MAAPTIRKFTFDVRFDDEDDYGHPVATRTAAAAQPMPVEEPEPEPEPEEPAGPPLLHTDEDLEIAREEAYVQGHTAALNEAAKGLERALAEAVEACGRGFAMLQPAVEDAQGEVGDLAVQVAMEVCRKMLPHAPEELVGAEVSALVKALMPELAGQPRVVVKTAPEMVERLRPLLQDIADRSGFEGRLVVLDEPGMEPGDARVEWADGGAERNTSRLWKAVDALVERNIPRFSRGEALELPDDEPAEPEPPEDVWPELDAATWYTPGTSAAEPVHEAEPEAEPEPEQDVEAEPEEDDEAAALSEWADLVEDVENEATAADALGAGTADSGPAGADGVPTDHDTAST